MCHHYSEVPIMMAGPSGPTDQSAPRPRPFASSFPPYWSTPSSFFLPTDSWQYAPPFCPLSNTPHLHTNRLDLHNLKLSFFFWFFLVGHCYCLLLKLVFICLFFYEVIVNEWIAIHVCKWAVYANQYMMMEKWINSKVKWQGHGSF